jgi:hypothetical protein
MQSISITERHRPARVAFIIPEGDQGAFERAVKLNTALLGGAYNPIISYSLSSQDEAIQLLDLFDPDFIHFLGGVARDWIPGPMTGVRTERFMRPYTSFGCVINHFLLCDVAVLIIYAWRHRALFQKQETPYLLALYQAASPHRLLYLTVFGDYPSDFSVDYRNLYCTKLNPYHYSFVDHPPILPHDAFSKISPLKLTIAQLSSRFVGQGKVRRAVFVGDPADTQDLVDFWNLRACGVAQFFVPLDAPTGFEAHFREECDQLRDSGNEERLVVLYRRGTLAHAIQRFNDWIYSAIPGDMLVAHQVSEPGFWSSSNLPRVQSTYEEEHHSLAPVADGRFEFHLHLPACLESAVESRRETFLFTDLSLTGFYDDLHLTQLFRDPALEHQFRRRIVHHDGRITDEGPSVLRSWADRKVLVLLPSAFEVIETLFEHRGMRIEPSQPGRVAQKIIQGLNGIEGCRIFKVKAVRDALDQLNDGRHQTVSKLCQEIGKGLQDHPSDICLEPMKQVSQYQPREIIALMHRFGMIQQGWELRCETCSKRAWYPVKDLGEMFVCHWCFFQQRTPHLSSNEEAIFSYRGNGLYLAENKMEGCVPVVLCLWRLFFLSGVPAHGLFTTNVEVAEATKERTPLGELDFTYLSVPGTTANDYALVLGEARGHKNFVVEDVEKVRRICDRFEEEFEKEHLVLCFGTLHDSFTEAEKGLLKDLGQQGYNVMPLTRQELDPHDLFRRFEGMPHQFGMTLGRLAENTRKLNLT